MRSFGAQDWSWMKRTQTPLQTATDSSRYDCPICAENEQIPLSEPLSRCLKLSLSVALMPATVLTLAKLLATLLDYPFPTIALLTGHTFGGACPFALSHDYRIMNSSRGFFSMPPVNLGLHFPGIGFLPRLKLRPQIARKMLLEAHRWTGKEALEDGIVDEIADPKEMLEVALRKARSIQGKSKMGVYSLLRNELWGEAAEKIRGICYVHGKRVTAPAKAKI